LRLQRVLHKKTKGKRKKPLTGGGKWGLAKGDTGERGDLPLRRKKRKSENGNFGRVGRRQGRGDTLAVFELHVKSAGRTGGVVKRRGVRGVI